ncbi:MAG TPA: DnaJ domain-containing protein [Kiritimatiellia bacterium]|nr:DnaJ domain-containing protein [Kiritimatiellia bacterium]HMP00646.1 DnaJ domain-containing protein [Kiritimatiellia bacterium]
METLIYIILIIAGLIFAAMTLVIYGIPLGIVLLLGLISIPIQRSALVAPHRAFQFIAILPHSSAKPWQVAANKVESAVTTEWLSVVGWICTVIPSILVVMNITRSAGDAGEVFCSAVVGIMGVIAGGYIAVNYPKWTKEVIVKGVKKDLENGVAGLEQAIELKQLSQEVAGLYSDSLGVRPPENIDNSFFSELASGSTHDCERRIRATIQDTQQCIADLRAAISSHKDACDIYKRVSLGVNRSGFGSLITEMDEIYTGLYSEQLFDLLRIRDWTTFNDVLASLRADLDRIERLAQNHATGSNAADKREDMSREKALEILGVGPDDSMEEVKRRYRALVKQLHPDGKAHLSEAEVQRRAERFKRVQAAWELMESGSIA